MKTISDKQYDVPRTTGHTTDRGRWTDGVVLTPSGIVRVYSEAGFTVMQLICFGQLWEREVRGGPRYSGRGLATIAARFADDVATGLPF